MWFLLDKISKEFEDVEKEMKSIEIGVKIRRPKKPKNVLNSRRLRNAEQKLRAGRNGYDAMAFCEKPATPLGSHMQSISHSYYKT